MVMCNRKQQSNHMLISTQVIVYYSKAERWKEKRWKKTLCFWVLPVNWKLMDTS